jgi:AcrR family transcriptional regulator
MRLTRAEAVQANRQALLAAARRQIVADGPSVSVEAIAAAADLTTGAIYSIFGSKRDLLIEVLIDDIAQSDAILADFVDPAPSLRDVIERYTDAWFALSSNGAGLPTPFELQVILDAIGDERLAHKLVTALDNEVDRLTDLLTNRRVDDSNPHRVTTADEARSIAHALKATITGFALRKALIPQSRDLIRRSCVALVGALDEA